MSRNNHNNHNNHNHNNNKQSKPWWVDDDGDEDKTPYNIDEYSVDDDSLYIEGHEYVDEDNDDDDDDDARSDTNVVPDEMDHIMMEHPPPRRIAATATAALASTSRTRSSTSRSSSSSSSPPPKAKAAPSLTPSSRSFRDTTATTARATSAEMVDPFTATTAKSSANSSSSSSSSPPRKSLQELSAKISHSTAKLSKSLSQQWKSISSVRSSPDRSKASSSSSKEERQRSSSKMQDVDPTFGAGAAAVVASSATATSAMEEPPLPKRQSLANSGIGKSLSQLGKAAMLSLGAANRNAAGERSQSNLTATTQRESSRSTSRSSSVGSGSNNSSGNGNNGNGSFHRYTVKELIHSLGRVDVELPPALERRVRDFKFAQGKRGERHGDNNKPWGIFGLYAHLSDIRADLEWAEDAAWRRQRSEPYLSWADFEKSRDKGLRNRPWFTYGVIALCSIMLVVTIGVNGWKFEPLNVNPLIGPSSETLVKCGARETNLIVNDGQWFRLFTPMVLHAGLVHFFFNMAAMFFIGGAVEQSHGFASAAVLFILPAVGGNIISAICLPQYISVGASGGIFGLIGGCLADISINWNLLFLKSTADAQSRWRHFMVLFWLAFDIILNCILGFTPFVDNFTHLGGFLYGLLCGLSTMDRLAVGFFGLQSDKYSKAWNTFMRFFGLIASVICIMVTTVVLVQSDGVSNPCHGCRYISCVPFPPRSEAKWWYCDDCDFVTADLFVDGGGSGLYQEIELECPNGAVESIDIAPDGLYDREDVRRALPTYCRNHCEDVFMESN